MMRFFFDFLFAVYVIIYFPILILRGKWHSGFKARLGCIPAEVEGRLRSRKNIWLHAVSVGEVVAIEDLMKRLTSLYPDHQLVLSVTTKTGHSLAQRKYSQRAVVIWSPLDFSFTVSKYLRVINPLFYFAAETELWPNLFEALAKRNIPLFVVNGRISDAAFGRYKAVRWALKTLLSRPKLFVMQSELDAARIVDLGAKRESVKVAGNVKFDNTPLAVDINRKDFGFSGNHQIFVAGSTHPGEEEMLIHIFSGLKTAFPNLRLVLVPRHPERAKNVKQLVSHEGYNPVYFSEAPQSLKESDVLIVDTIGQLMELYSIADVVFVGKSLTVKGGHNIIEPAVFAKPNVVGPYMENFKDIVRVFLAEDAIVQVKDELELKKSIAMLLSDPSLARAKGLKAQNVVRKNAGAGERTIAILRKALN